MFELTLPQTVAVDDDRRSKMLEMAEQSSAISIWQKTHSEANEILPIAATHSSIQSTSA